MMNFFSLCPSTLEALLFSGHRPHRLCAILLYKVYYAMYSIEFEFIHLYNFSVRQKTSFSCLVPGKRQLELEEFVQTAAEGATVACMDTGSAV